MNRTTVLAVAAVLLVAAAPLGAAVQPAMADDTSSVSGSATASASGSAAAMTNHSTNESTNNSSAMAPGERLAGVFGVQQAELQGSVEQRAFGVRIAAAASANAKAAVVANQSAELDQRLAALEERKQRVQAAYENGSISKGAYQARMAALAAQTQTLTELANTTEQTARGLPEDVLREHGVNVSAIAQLQQQAKNLTGPEVAAIAHTIAGPTIGAPGNVTRGPPAGVPAGNVTVGNGTGANATVSEQRARQAINQAEAQIAQADHQVSRATSVVTAETGEAATALDQARSNLSAAKTTLADARTALENGNIETALTLAQQAQANATVAEEHARSAIELSGSVSVTVGTETTTTSSTTAPTTTDTSLV
ncbi:DUF7096 domain-containing protein [Halospeciosus flavus]|uniref:DUF7096 domain-containing protein n=1 Tax=Halospeciosus flavus TaxID=3032283 RepID=A0ABD5Z6Z6_9EURY|nr:hypothetical protein [Halospeciosus flavus]